MTHLSDENKIISAAPAPAVPAHVVVSATEQIGALELSRNTLYSHGISTGAVALS